MGGPYSAELPQGIVYAIARTYELLYMIILLGEGCTRNGGHI